jgi:hypothetical protein
MIVIARKVGFLGNRLLLFAQFIACARESGTRVVNPAFDEYAKFFQATASDVLCSYPPRVGKRPPTTWARRLLYWLTYLPVRALIHLRCMRWPVAIVRIRMGQDYSLGSPEFRRLVKDRKLVCIQGWSFHNHECLLKHSDAIRDYLRPVDLHLENIDRLIAAAREDADLLVGIHIRHGDYAKYEGGRYFYSRERYYEVMRSIEDLLAPRTVRFLVCSNAPQQSSSFPGLHVTFGTGHLVEDMYSLARCDYLAGPPSTFSGWASFYGKVPLWHLTSADQEINFDTLDTHWFCPDGLRTWREANEASCVLGN